MAPTEVESLAPPLRLQPEVAKTPVSVATTAAKTTRAPKMVLDLVRIAVLRFLRFVCAVLSAFVKSADDDDVALKTTLYAYQLR